MTETIDQKAERILLERRLLVKRVDGVTGLVIAECRGDSGAVYQLGYDPTRGEWRCTCEASAKFSRRCSHIRALQHVTAKKES